MPSSLARRIDRLERAIPRAGSYLLCWGDHGNVIPLQPPVDGPAQSSVPLYRRKVTYDRFASQRTFDEMRCTFKGFSGPVGSGKSKALCHEIIKCAYLNPGVPGLLGAPTEKLLATSTLIELLSILDEQGIPYHYRKSSNDIHLIEPNSTILLRTLDSPERLRAMNLGWFGIDELTYCKEAAWQRLEGRIRNPLARYRRGFAVWTPKGHDWVWRRFISSRKVENHTAVHAAPFENTAVMQAAPDYYENLKHSYDEKFYKQEVLGEYLDMFSGTVYHAFSEKNVRSCDFNPQLPLIVSMDFNVNPMCGVLLQCENSYGSKRVNVLREIVLPGSHTAEWCDQLLAATRPWMESLWSSGRTLEICFYGDATGGSTQASSGGTSNWDIVEQKMRCHQEYRAKFLQGRRNPAVLDRINAVNGILGSVADREKKQCRLYVDPSCRELAADFEEVKWKVDAHGNTYHELDKRDPKRTHASDALGYYIESEHGFGLRTMRTSSAIF